MDLYDLYFWPDNSQSDRGKSYLQESLKYFQNLLDTTSLFSNKENLEILEICGGAGYGSLSLASLLKDKSPKVLVTDSRDLVMESATLAAGLGINNIFKKLDALNIDSLNKKFDVIVMYGLSTPHFSPKEAIELYAKIKAALNDDGVLIVQEMDRRKALFLDGNYRKKAYAEGYGTRLVSEEKSYDVETGMVEREYYSEKEPTKRVSAKSFFWSIAETNALLSLYWEQVKSIPLGGNKYFLLATNELLNQ